MMPWPSSNEIMQTARAEVFVRALKVSPPAVVLMQLSFTGLHFGLVFNDLCSQSTRLPDCKWTGLPLRTNNTLGEYVARLST